MLICCFGCGMTSVAEANHSSSTRGGASGSAATAASISSSVIASKRDQSICPRLLDLADFRFKTPLLTPICLSCRDDPAILLAPSVEDGHQPSVDLAECQNA